jgi:hypothetical protein
MYFRGDWKVAVIERKEMVVPEFTPAEETRVSLPE